MFGSVLGLWDALSLGHGAPGKGTCGLTLMEWTSSWTSKRLSTPISSTHLLSQYVLHSEQIVGWRFCGWVDVQNRTHTYSSTNEAKREINKCINYYT